MAISILTDSCADLSQELLSKFKVFRIHLTVFINNQTYRDGMDITLPELYRQVDLGGQLPKTSAPSVAEFISFFERAPGELIFIGISSSLSATLQNAKLAAESLPGREIHIIDSKNLSTGTGLLVLHAADLREKGKSADQIVKSVETLIPRVRTSFVIDTLDYLYKGGRCTSMESVVGSLLKIRPVIEVRADGTLGVKEKNRGSRLRSMINLLDDFRIRLPEIDLHRVFVTHSGCEDDAQFLAKELNNMASIQEVIITTAGCTVSSHCGPNTIGIMYLTK